MNKFNITMYIAFQVKQVSMFDSVFGSEKQFHNRIDSLKITYKIGYRPYENFQNMN